MYKIMFTISLIFLLASVNAQNLVPNGGFEQVSSYPEKSSQIYKSITWYSPTGGTPDLHHKNGYSSYTEANLGKGYSFLILFKITDGGEEFKEYIQTKLKQPLVKGKEYTVQMYVKIAKYSLWSLNHIGVYFSDKPVLSKKTVGNIDVFNYVKCQSKSKRFIENPKKWVLLSGKYVANGGEEYITIGSFQNRYQTEKKVVHKESLLKSSAYFVDDISVRAVADTNKTHPELTIYFDPDSYIIDTSDFIKIRALSNSLTEDQHLNIIGYSDSSYNFEYNQKLSLKRASEVLNKFQTLGIEKNRMTIEGKGESENSRKVEIYLLKK